MDLSTFIYRDSMIAHWVAGLAAAIDRGVKPAHTENERGNIRQPW